MVFYTAVIEHITTDLASPLYLFLASLNLGLRLESLLHRTVVELRFEESHCVVTVLELLTALSVLDEDFFLLTGIGIDILITQTHTRLHLVDVLSTGTTASEEVPAYF